MSPEAPTNATAGYKTVLGALKAILILVAVAFITVYIFDLDSGKQERESCLETSSDKKTIPASKEAGAAREDSEKGTNLVPPRQDPHQVPPVQNSANDDIPTGQSKSESKSESEPKSESKPESEPKSESKPQFSFPKAKYSRKYGPYRSLLHDNMNKGRSRRKKSAAKPKDYGFPSSLLALSTLFHRDDNKEQEAPEFSTEGRNIEKGSNEVEEIKIKKDDNFLADNSTQSINDLSFQNPKMLHPRHDGNLDLKISTDKGPSFTGASQPKIDSKVSLLPPEISKDSQLKGVTDSIQPLSTGNTNPTLTGSLQKDTLSSPNEQSIKMSEFDGDAHVLGHNGPRQKSARGLEEPSITFENILDLQHSSLENREWEYKSQKALDQFFSRPEWESIFDNLLKHVKTDRKYLIDFGMQKMVQGNAVDGKYFLFARVNTNKSEDPILFLEQMKNYQSVGSQQCRKIKHDDDSMKDQDQPKPHARNLNEANAGRFDKSDNNEMVAEERGQPESDDNQLGSDYQDLNESNVDDEFFSCNDNESDVEKDGSFPDNVDMLLDSECPVFSLSFDPTNFPGYPSQDYYPIQIASSFGSQQCQLSCGFSNGAISCENGLDLTRNFGSFNQPDPNNLAYVCSAAGVFVFRKFFVKASNAISNLVNKW